MNIHDINEECRELIRLLQHYAEELKLKEHLKDIDARRADWERRNALFVPQKQRLERGSLALELTESFRAIRELRQRLDSGKIREDSLRRDMLEARTKLQNADESVNLMEGEYREKLQEKGRLEATIQRVKILDEQAADRQQALQEARKEYDDTERRLKDCNERLESEQKELERLELALREARKFLQQHATDEKLTTGLAGIKKTFALYEQADKKRISLRHELDEAIAKRQEAQAVLNDRAALFSEVSNRYAVLEKQHAKAKAFFDTSLRGKSIAEWNMICDENIKRLAALDEIYAKFQELMALESQLKALQDSKLKLQQDVRNLGLKETEQQSAINALNDEIADLSNIQQLLERIGDLGAVRELLSGSVSAKYSSTLPDPAVIREDLSGKRSLCEQLNESLKATQSAIASTNEEISRIDSDDSDSRTKLAAMNADLAQRISALGLKFTPGIPPMEELERERHRTRDSLQLARNNADTSESAQRDLTQAEDELTKITQKRSQVSMFHQEALFTLRTLTSQEEHCSTECKAHNEALARLKRELISRITPYGWKTVPDTQPEQVVETLSRRLKAWQDGTALCDKLEREMTVAQAKMSSLRKERESVRVKHSELLSRVKALESDRDSIRQQRIILFESKVPESESLRLESDIKAMREQLESRQESKKQRAEELNGIMTAVHALETEQAVTREELHRQEITFGKRLLELGFRNEDDYSSAILTNDERRDLQSRLRELTETDFDLNTERENTRAKLQELEGGKDSMTKDELTSRINALKKKVAECMTEESSPEREKLAGEYIPTLKELILTCGLEEVF